MAKANKEQIVSYILKLVSAKDEMLVKKTVEAFGVSKSTVYNYIKELCDNGILQKEGVFYTIVSQNQFFLYDNTTALDESRIFEKDIAPIFRGFEKNVFSIWRYAFTEMMNNAIEHSSSNEIIVVVFTNPLESSIMIADNGIGIFKNIQAYMKAEHNRELPLDECASLLFAGKFTTAKSMHSGEGIFFTSHLMDSFFIFSDDVIFSRNNFNDTQVKSIEKRDSTTVCMSLSNHTKKTTKEVFDRFSNVDEGFIKTQIPIAHIFPYGDPVSRSEGRRLGELIIKFREVDLDFAGVDEVGQAFCHELFVVWQGRNPNITLNVLNAEEDVLNMIKRVINTK